MQSLPERTLVYLIGAEYSAYRKCIRLIFYEPEQNVLYDWYDIYGHDPYCLTNLSPIELERIPRIKNHPALKKLKLIDKYDALQDKMVWVTKIVTDDPSAIGGKRRGTIRDIIPSTCSSCFSEKLKMVEKDKKDEKDRYSCPKCGVVKQSNVWEARIPYDCCYSYDLELEMGMPYILYDNQLIQESIPEIQGRIADVADKLGVNIDGDNGEEESRKERWISLLEYPVPEFLRCALDIEVLGETKNIPDPNKAEYPIISASIVGSDGVIKTLILLREGVEIGEEDVSGVMEFFEKEVDLIDAIFTEIARYPFVITFNGDNFDLPYVHNRALNLGFEDTPIRMARRKIGIRNAVHIDLYRFFFNKSIQNYAFGGKYKSATLDEIATALIGEGKIKSDMDMRDWSYSQLAKYNAQDGIITLKLTTFDDSLVMKLIVVLARIATMSIDDLTRFPISQWIRGMLFYELRKRNVLIPNRGDLLEAKGKTSTKAIVKGKKYKGAIVIDPVAGIHFDTKVMDFWSLYPTIFKIKNLGFATIRCTHEECKDNLIPETTHWVCKKNKSIEAEIIGFLKDLRVFHYKKLRANNPWYKVVEQAVKVLLNASYGVFGDVKFDLYCPPISESVTAVGRTSISLTIEEAQRLGIKVLYGDTDSVFLHEPTEEQVRLLCEWSIKTLELDLGVDKSYRYVCLSSRKKNYMGVTPEGEVDVKGMTGKKKHIPWIIKEAFNVTKKYFANAQTREEVEALRGALTKVVRGVYLRIKRRDFNLEEMAFHITLGKSPKMYEKSVQHVTAARMLEGEGIIMKKGDIVSFVKVKGKWHNPDSDMIEETNVKPLSMATKKEVDVEKYYEMLRSTFGQILDSLDIDFNEIIGVCNLAQFY